MLDTVIPVATDIMQTLRVAKMIKKAVSLTVSMFRWLRDLWNEHITPPQSLTDAPMSETDLKMCEKTREIIDEVFEGDIFEAVSDASYSERIAYAENLIQRLTGEYGLNLENCSLYVDSNVDNCGGFIIRENRIKLNVAALFSEDKDQTCELINTIVHELRHAVQWSAVKSEEFAAQWDISEETREKWKQNFLNYITPQQDLHAYTFQPVEDDARTFAFRSLKESHED